MKSQKSQKRKTATAADPMNQSLLTDIRDLIFSARHQVAQAVNAGLTMLYWEIGRRIRQDILEEKRGVYGKEIVAALGGDNWNPSSDEASARKTCTGWCNLPRFSPMKKLSLHCGDN
jgi:hypothetical protein